MTNCTPLGPSPFTNPEPPTNPTEQKIGTQVTGNNAAQNNNRIIADDDSWQLIGQPQTVTSQHILSNPYSSFATNPEAILEALSKLPTKPTSSTKQSTTSNTFDDSSWQLIEKHQAITAREAPTLLIRAINVFIHQGQIPTARSAIELLRNYSLTLDERFSLQIIQAKLAGVSGNPQRAIQLLNALDYAQIQNIATKKQALTVLAKNQLALGRPVKAMATLLNIELLLSTIPDSTEQLENQQEILHLLQASDALQISLLRNNLPNPHLDGWLALADTLMTTTSAYVDVDLSHWRLTYPDHPAQSQLLAQYAGLGELDEYRRIALLLPLTSPYGTAAGAFYDGFMQAHSNNISSKPPEVILYDVGEDIRLSSFYYQAAANEGADFVVGPLGKKAVETLLSSRQPEITTLLLADIPLQNKANNLFGISLSPEKEARQIADKAFTDGHRQATVFRSQSEWGGRVADAFVSQWQLLGGTIVKNKSFPNDISDYTRVIQKFLGLDKSIARARLLEAQLGTNLTFTPRRNDDMDMLFLAANADQSRLVVPQLRFFQAHNLPIYATSYVYSGNPNPALDADLDGLIFGDMKWMLEGVARYKLKVAAKQAQKVAPNNNEPAVDDSAVVQGNNGSLATTNQVSEGSQQNAANEPRTPYQTSTLNRLYALGIQSYQIIPRLNSLRRKNQERFLGRAMAVSVSQDGNVVRHPLWAQFVSGLAEPIDPVSKQ